MGSIIEKYQLSFVKTDEPRTITHAFLFSNSDPLLNYHLSGYFLEQSISFLLEDVLPEIEKAIIGQPFDDDAGGTLNFLTIGMPISTFSGMDEAKEDLSIPTEDVRDIIIFWVEQVKEYNLHYPAVITSSNK
jgi:hypothetical protein